MASALNKNIAIITSEEGSWNKEIVSLAQEKWYSPWQWRRMYEEKMSPEKREAMAALRRADDKIRRFSDDLRALVGLIPKDPTRLADVALVLGEINQKLLKIQEAGKDIKDVRRRRLADFYGRFSVDIPRHLRSNKSSKADLVEGGKIANAGVISNFVQMLGRKIFELTDPEIREMKRVIVHLTNNTKNLSNSIDRHLADMLRARQTGNIGEYIDSLKSIADEQAAFEEEYLSVYDAYLKEPYEQALASAEKNSYEKIVVGPAGELEVVEVPPEKIEEERAKAESMDEEVVDDIIDIPETIPGTIPQAPLTQPEWKGIAPSNVSEEQRQKMLGESPSPIETAPPTRQVDMEQTRRYDPDLAKLRKMMPPPIPAPAMPAALTEEERLSGFPAVAPVPKTVRQIPATQKEPVMFDDGIDAESPPSTEMDVPVSEEWSSYYENMAPDTQWDPRVTMTSQQIIDKNKNKPIPPSPVEVAIEAAKYNRFLEKLDEIAETNNKYIVAAFISKYSEELENVNSKVATNLLKLAQNVDNLDKELLVNGVAYIWDNN